MRRLVLIGVVVAITLFASVAYSQTPQPTCQSCPDLGGSIGYMCWAGGGPYGACYGGGLFYCSTSPASPDCHAGGPPTPPDPDPWDPFGLPPTTCFVTDIGACFTLGCTECIIIDLTPMY